MSEIILLPGCYQRKNKSYGRVTNVLKSVGIVDPRWFTEYSAIRGQYAHMATALYDKNTLDMESLDSSLVGYVKGWIKFRKETENRFQITHIEEMVYSDSLMFAGTLDRLVFEYSTKRTGILDIKCVTSLDPAVEIQTAGYEMAWRECTKFMKCLINRYAVQLFPNGTYKLKELNRLSDASIWLSAINIYNWQINRKGKSHANLN